MKKVKYLIEVLMITAVFSCNNDDKPVFDQSDAERLKSRIEEDQNILTSAENGWITDYRPDDQFGYFKLWFQFNKDGTVHTLSDIPLVNDDVGRGGIFAPHPGFYKDTTTHYRISSQHSVDLVFEDPMALHYLYSLTSSEGDEFKSGAEFEFYITHATSEEVVLESKTDRGKGKQQKTQIILKKAIPEDKEKIKKSYAEWKRLSLINTPYFYLSDTLDEGTTNIEKRTVEVGEARKIFPITEVSPYHIKVEKDKDRKAIYSQVMIGEHPMIVIPKGEDTGALPELKFAESGKAIAIDPAKITLEGVDKNQVGVYNAVLHVGNLALDKKVVVYDPSITGADLMVTGSYYDIDRPERTGVTSLVEGTPNIFLASDFGLNGIFPVYFQMNGNKASVIQQTYVYDDIVRVALNWDPGNRRMQVLVRNEKHKEKHPDDPDYGWLYTFQMKSLRDFSLALN